MTPRGIRNNNPGNLDNTNPWQGLVANPAEPRFATFKDPTWGVRALAVTLITYHDKRKAKDGSRIDTIQKSSSAGRRQVKTTLRRMFKPSRKR